MNNPHTSPFKVDHVEIEVMAGKEYLLLLLCSSKFYGCFDAIESIIVDFISEKGTLRFRSINLR